VVVFKLEKFFDLIKAFSRLAVYKTHILSALL